MKGRNLTFVTPTLKDQQNFAFFHLHIIKDEKTESGDNYSPSAVYAKPNSKRKSHLYWQ